MRTGAQGRGPGGASSAGLSAGAGRGWRGVVLNPENATGGEDWLFTLTAFDDTGESDPSPAQPAALP